MALRSLHPQELALALDLMGYSTFMIKCRRDLYQSFAEKQTTPYPFGYFLDILDFKVFIVGSRREGTSVQLSSDTDYMLVFKSILCSEHKPQSTEGANKVWIKLIQENVEPGYVLLQTTTSFNGLKSLLFNTVCDKQGSESFISSQKLSSLLYDLYKRVYDYLSSKGTFELLPPQEQTDDCSIKLRLSSKEFNDADVIVAFPCEGLDFMREWETRERKYGWPGAATIEKIRKMYAYVVPKGSKNSQKSNLEFRICHTLGEIELIKSLNETQLKVYILLKELFKSEEIVPHNPDIITSYVLKNVVFQLCETKSAESFSIGDLLDRVKDALMYIHKCLLNGGVIPNYFIPRRNLLAGKTEAINIQEIKVILERWITEGDNLYLNQESIRKNIMVIKQNEPNGVQQIIKDRDEDESETLKHLDWKFLSEIIKESTEKAYLILPRMVVDVLKAL